MKRGWFFAALSAILLFASPAFGQDITCRQTAQYDTNTNGSTVLVTGISTGQIYICGYSIWSAGTATVKLVRGTGTTCATNETAITPAFSLVTQTGVFDSSSIWRGMFAPASTDLCIKTSAGVAVQAIVFYVQR